MQYKYLTTKSLFKAICNSIRRLTGKEEDIKHQDIPDEINKITNIVKSILDGSIVELESDVKNIPENIFSGCWNLKSVYLPKTTSIDNYAFCDCRSLDTINLPEVTTIGNGAFHDYNHASYITTLNLPKCNYIGDDAFLSAKVGPEIINLPSCTYIGSNSFSGAAWGSSVLKTVILPKCTYIGNDAFSYNKYITTFILSNQEICTIGGSIGIPYSCSIYVYDDLVDDYKAANNWSMYYINQIKPLSELPPEYSKLLTQQISYSNSIYGGEIK